MKTKMKTKLQILTENNSDSLSVLFHSFEKKFPEEKGCIALLREFIYNTNASISTEKVLEALIRIQK